MKLPCRHILVVQTKLEMSLYGEELCDVHWSVQYYEENQHIFQIDCSANGDSPSATIAKLLVSKKQPMSQVDSEYSSIAYIICLTLHRQRSFVVYQS